MKKATLIIAATAFIFTSCGTASKNEKEENTAKVSESSINKQIEILNKSSISYCACLGTKSIEDCNELHLKVNEEFDKIMANIDELPKNGVKDPQVMENLRNKAIPLFDRKADCAKMKMRGE